MASNSLASNSLGSSIFWIILLLISQSSLLFLMLWSFQNNSVRGVAIGLIYFAFIMAGLILSKFTILNSGTWGSNSLSFTLGFVIWLVLDAIKGTTGLFSVLSLNQNALFSTISTQLPRVLEFIVGNILIPISEELFWLIGLPFALITVMRLAGVKNPVIQLVVVVLISGISFALFHVGALLFSFLFAAMIFRTAVIVFTLGDRLFNTVPFLEVLPAFAVGAHIGNNWGFFGFIDGLQLLVTNLHVGIIVFIFFGVVIISAVNEIVVLVAKGLKL